MLDSKFFERFKDHIPASKLQDSRLWDNMVEAKKKKVMAQIVSEA